MQCGNWVAEDVAAVASTAAENIVKWVQYAESVASNWYCFSFRDDF